MRDTLVFPLKIEREKQNNKNEEYETKGSMKIWGPDT